MAGQMREPASLHQREDDGIIRQEPVLSAERRRSGDKGRQDGEDPDFRLEHRVNDRLKQGELFYHVGLLLQAVQYLGAGILTSATRTYGMQLSTFFASVDPFT